jgi:hypothetical protein
MPSASRTSSRSIASSACAVRCFETAPVMAAQACGSTSIRHSSAAAVPSGVPSSK